MITMEEGTVVVGVLASNSEDKSPLLKEDGTIGTSSGNLIAHNVNVSVSDFNVSNHDSKDISNFNDDGDNELSTTAVYPIRWYLLLLISVNGFAQGLLYNTFGPISETSKYVFNWTNWDIAWLANWGYVVFFLFLFPFHWVFERRGLRAATLISLGVTFIGVSLRLFPVLPEHYG